MLCAHRQVSKELASFVEDAELLGEKYSGLYMLVLNLDDIYVGWEYRLHERDQRQVILERHLHHAVYFQHCDGFRMLIRHLECTSTYQSSHSTRLRSALECAT